MNKSIKLYKLITGDEIVAEESFSVVSADAPTTIRLMKPRVLVPVLGPKGPQIMLRPFYLGNPQHEVVTVRTEHIIDTAPVQKVLEDAYLQETSGLILGGRVS